MAVVLLEDSQVPQYWRLPDWRAGGKQCGGG